MLLSQCSSSFARSAAPKAQNRASLARPARPAGTVLRGTRMMAAASTGDRMANPQAIEMWKKADAVCFDVDSTVCVDEGIDELAAFMGAGEAVAALTAKAMGGSVPFEVALDQRLTIINPTREKLDEFLASRPPRLTPGVAQLVTTLKAKGKAVYLVSGGFTQMIFPVAALLGLPKEHVFANTILFDAAGKYAGFDREAFTSRSGGKARAIEALKAKHGYKTLVMIGDGATDLEARKPGGAEAFVGFGGIAQRKVVMEGADWYVTSFEPLTSAL